MPAVATHSAVLPTECQKRLLPLWILLPFWEGKSNVQEVIREQPERNVGTARQATQTQAGENAVSRDPSRGFMGFELMEGRCWSGWEREPHPQRHGVGPEQGGQIWAGGGEGRLAGSSSC